MTVKKRAEVVPVASVPVLRKLVPHVNVKLDVPLVVIENVSNRPVIPPEPLNVHAPVGVIVTMSVVIDTVIVPVVAVVAAVVPAGMLCKAVSAFAPCAAVAAIEETSTQDAVRGYAESVVAGTYVVIS